MARADLNHSSESEVVRHPTMRSLFIGTQWESATLCPVQFAVGSPGGCNQ